MKRNFFNTLLMVFSPFGSGRDSKPSADFALIDRYLTTWDQFARGDNSLMPRIKQDRAAFEQHLSDALIKNDNRAPGRFVFYAVVQVGGFIPLASPLGQAFQQRVGEAVPIFTDEKDNSQSYFAGDLYFWWEAHKSEYASFPLYEEWSQRDFARNVAIRMYQGAASPFERMRKEAEQATTEFKNHIREVRSKAKPLTIELVTTTDTEWLDSPAFQQLTRFLSSRGFETAGVVAVKGNAKNIVAGFAAPQHAAFASIPKGTVQAFVSFVSDFADGSVFECSNMPVPVEPSYPDWLTHRRCVGTSAEALWSYFQRERPPKATIAANPARFAKSSTEAMFRYRAWMAERGGETREEIAARHRVAGKLPPGAEGDKLLDIIRNDVVEQSLCNWWRLQPDAPCPVERVLDSLVIIHDEMLPPHLINAYWCGTGDLKPVDADFAEGSPREAFARVVSSRGAHLRRVMQKHTALQADFYLPE